MFPEGKKETAGQQLQLDRFEKQKTGVSLIA